MQQPKVGHGPHQQQQAEQPFNDEFEPGFEQQSIKDEDQHHGQNNEVMEIAPPPRNGIFNHININQVDDQTPQISGNFFEDDVDKTINTLRQFTNQIRLYIEDLAQHQR